MDGDAKGPGVISSPWSSGGKGHWRSGIIYPSPDQNQSKLLQFMVVHYFDVLAGTDVVGSITVHRCYFIHWLLQEALRWIPRLPMQKLYTGHIGTSC
ncbi:uncharacterized protein LOC124666134 isoform X2 [Lolium rigidum]|uniref:uncharacterized protein LOC124666134 isoform X2 n=1 Tax=Lolium rigidum TaxID=89674 RepID=UPI001F5D461B|nr:uncharacterized protein LOC124666134 isoform X2 [Lolium rigidum]